MIKQEEKTVIQDSQKKYVRGLWGKQQGKKENKAQPNQNLPY